MEVSRINSEIIISDLLRGSKFKLLPQLQNMITKVTHTKYLEGALQKLLAEIEVDNIIKILVVKHGDEVDSYVIFYLVEEDK